MNRIVVAVFVLSISISGSYAIAQAPQINTGGIVNGASFVAGAAVAPGSIASLFGSGFGSSPAAVTIQLNGITAPLFSVSPTQINFQVPWELSGRSSASVTVTVGGVMSNLVNLSLSAYAPGIFAADASKPSGQGAILVANTAVLAGPVGAFPGSEPVTPGEFISVYVTGLGPVTNNPGTGVAAPSSPSSATTAKPTVTVGGVLANVTFSGLAPGFFGLYQVNLQVPPDAPGGDAVPVQVTIGGSLTISNTVTIAVASSAQQQAGGPPGANVLALAIAPANANTIYAGAASGIFKSTNGGGNWSAINSGLTSKNIQALAIDPATLTTVYAGAVGGVFKSIDGGANWSAVNSGLPGVRNSLAMLPPPANGITGTQVLALAIDPSNTATIYAVVSETVVGVSGGLGKLYKSSNGGASWTPANTGMEGCTLFPVSLNPAFSSLCTPSIQGLPDTFMESLAIDPQNPSTLYAGTVPGGVFKSTDGGAHWSSVNFSNTATDVEIVLTDPSKSGTLYAVAHNNIIRLGPPGSGNLPNNELLGTSSGIFKSTDGGSTWAAINSGLPVTSLTGLSGTSIIVQSFAIDPSNSSALYAAEAEASDAGLFKSTNGGATWTATGFDLAPGSLTINPSQPAVIYAGTSGEGIFKSIDGGATWSPSESGLLAASVPAVAIDPTNSANVYAGAGGGIFKSIDAGASWSEVNVSPALATLLLDPSNPSTLYAGAGLGVLKSIDAGATWNSVSNGFPQSGFTVAALAISSSETQTLYAGTNASGMFKSTDGGADWTAIDNGLPNFGTASNPITLIQAVAADPSNANIVYALAFGVFKSTDGGASWFEADSGIPSPINVAVLAIDPANPMTIYAGSTSGLFKSVNGGGTWAAVSPPGFTPSASSGPSIVSIAIDPTNSATVYAGSNIVGSARAWKTTDGGKTWTTANGGLPNDSVIALAVDPENPNTVYAGTGAFGAFKSTDGGQNWNPTGGD